MDDFHQLSDFFLSPQNNGRQGGLWRRLLNSLASRLPTRKQFYHLPKVLSKNERYFLFFLVLVGLLALFSIPVITYQLSTVSVPADGGKYTEGMVGTPQYINPLLVQDSDVDRDLTKIVFAGLMKQTASGSLEYDLAKGYSVSADGLEYRFELKDNLHWQDGVLLTTDDVVFTMQAAQNPDYLSPLQIIWRGVEVTKINDNTVSFRLKNRYAQFLNNTTLGILPKHLWGSVKPSNFRLSTLNSQPLGAGPYRFDSLVRTEGTISAMTFKAFAGYHSGRPHIDQLTFRFFQSSDYDQSIDKAVAAFNNGDIDGLNYLPIKKIGDVRASDYALRNLKLPRYYAVFFNQSKSKPLSDKNVRQALSLATDRDGLVSSLLQGHGERVDSPLLPGIINVKKPVKAYDFNVNKAAVLLDNAGWHVTEDSIREKTIGTKTAKNPDPEKIRLTVELTTRDSPELLSTANMLKEQWLKIGVEVTVKTVSAAEISQQVIKDRDYESLLYGEVLSLNPDPFSFWHSSQKKEPGLNLSLYDNGDADKILENARDNMDFSQRLQGYSTLQDIILDDAPAVFLYSPDYIYLQTASVLGTSFSIVGVPADRFNDIGSWYLRTKRVKL